jgi:hypothetical protein
VGRRIINLGGGNYNVRIEGDYIQRDKKEPRSQSTNARNDEPAIDVTVISSEIVDRPSDVESINTHGANYTEHVGSTVINRHLRNTSISW